jgi:chemotaxis protein methyltransferase CheR
VTVRDPAEAPVLTADELRRFCEFLYARTGMQFGETKRYYIERRLIDRLVATNALSFANYLLLLRSDPVETAAIINSFTVNETYFYREEHQLRCLSQDILPEVIKSRGPGDKVRIWSQPCSTGEEAYSIALWLLENWRLVDAYNIEIIGSDIDGDALVSAREGTYGDRALSRLPQPVIDAYFEPPKRGKQQIIDDLRESVSFSAGNLIDRGSMRDHGVFDVIFCRNVLIYFDDDSRSRAVAHLYDSLAPGGFICLGHTESMSRISDRFLVRRFPDAIVYQRPYA